MRPRTAGADQAVAPASPQRAAARRHTPPPSPGQRSELPLPVAATPASSAVTDGAGARHAGDDAVGVGQAEQPLGQWRRRSNLHPTPQAREQAIIRHLSSCGHTRRDCKRQRRCRNQHLPSRLPRQTRDHERTHNNGHTRSCGPLPRGRGARRATPSSILAVAMPFPFLRLAAPRTALRARTNRRKSPAAGAGAGCGPACRGSAPPPAKTAAYPCAAAPRRAPVTTARRS